MLTQKPINRDGTWTSSLLAMVLLLGQANVGRTHQGEGPAIDIREFAKESLLIFKGTVVDVV